MEGEEKGEEECQLMHRSKYTLIHLCISCLSFMFHCSSIKML